jgi:hypothetical protein
LTTFGISTSSTPVPTTRTATPSSEATCTTSHTSECAMRMTPSSQRRLQQHARSLPRRVRRPARHDLDRDRRQPLQTNGMQTPEMPLDASDLPHPGEAGERAADPGAAMFERATGTVDDRHRQFFGSTLELRQVWARRSDGQLFISQPAALMSRSVPMLTPAGLPARIRDVPIRGSSPGAAPNGVTISRTRSRAPSTIPPPAGATRRC